MGDPYKFFIQASFVFCPVSSPDRQNTGLLCHQNILRQAVAQVSCAIARNTLTLTDLGKHIWVRLALMMRQLDNPILCQTYRRKKWLRV